MVNVKNLTKKFGGYTAVNNVSFSLKEGEILGFLGPNGAGKTTTIQILMGIMTPTCGEITFFGKDLRIKRSEIMEYVNFSSTYTHLPSDLTVQEVLKYSVYFYNIDDRKGRIKKIISLFKLKELLKQKISDLSAGQLTRVNLAKSMINYPRVLMLDEPTASLDPEAALFVRDFIKTQQKDFNVSVLITSHNMAEVEDVCDRVIFINKGKIFADDTPANLAKSVQIVQLELKFQQGVNQIKSFCKKYAYQFSELDGNTVRIKIDEENIADLLAKMAAEKINFIEISIQKPSLEDYFIQVVKNNASKTL